MLVRNDSDIINRVSKFWNSMPAAQRREAFRLSKKALFAYSNWENLCDIEKQLVLNAARIVGKFGGRP